MARKTADWTAIAASSAVLLIWALTLANCGGEDEPSVAVTSSPTTSKQTTTSELEGEKIAFISDREGNFEIYVMNIDGTGVTRLTETDAREGEPVWWSDGSEIAFDIAILEPLRDLENVPLGIAKSSTTSSVSPTPLPRSRRES